MRNELLTKPKFEEWDDYITLGTYPLAKAVQTDGLRTEQNDARQNVVQNVWQDQFMRAGA